MMRWCAVLVVLAGCGDAADLAAPAPAQGEQLALYPAAVRFVDAAGLDNRHEFEITGPDWDSPHTLVSDEVWRSDGLLTPEGTVVPTWSEPAPYTSGTPLRVLAPLVWRGSGEGPLQLTGIAALTLRSATDDAYVLDLGTVAFDVDAVESREEAGATLITFEDAVVEAQLPRRVDLWSLDIDWSISTPGGPSTTVRSTHSIPTSWRNPIADAPLYRESVVWAARWAAGTWPDYGPGDPRTDEMQHLIALSELHGSRTLEDSGYSYGSFRRPPRDQIDDRVNVFLDFHRSACGEFRGLLMALIEFHGIDAHWIWFRFPEPGVDRYSFYKTRPVSAVGRETKNWYDTNHIIVGVGDRVYDPTYTVSKQSWQEYEDWMFEKYCRGRAVPCTGANDWCHRPPDDEDRTCIDNPPGWQQDGHLEVIMADNYK